MSVLQKIKGNLGGAVKGIKGRSQKSHKTRLVLLALLFTAAFCVFVTATLFANSSYVPEDNVHEMNYERSQVFVSGNGYTLANYKKKQHNLEEEQRNILQGEEPPEINEPEDEEEEDDDDSDTSSNSGFRRTYPGSYSYPRSSYSGRTYNGYNRYNYNRYNNQNRNTNKKKTEKKKKEKQSEYDKKKSDVKKDPKIKIKGIKKGAKVKGKTKKFTVRAYSFEGDEITGDGLVVKLNGKKLKPVKEHTYKGTIIDGDNKLVIKATDDSGNTKKTTIKFKGITDEEPEVIGSLEVGVSAEVLGIDLVVPMGSVDIYDNEQLSDVVKRYFKNASGVSVVAKDSSYYSIERIKMDGILDGIPDDIAEELEELGIPVPDDKDSLGTDDFGLGSGWVYTVDGKAAKNYMSDVEPGDETVVEIYYVIPELD